MDSTEGKFMSVQKLSVSSNSVFAKRSDLAPLSTSRSSVAISIVPELGNNSATVKLAQTRVENSKVSGPSKTMQQDSATPLQDDKEYEKTLDYKLVLRVQKGDKKAFDLLVIKYQGRVASVVSRFISDYHEIADVTQEAFIKAYRAIGKFRGDSAFYTWLYRIAINCAKNYLVSRGRRPPSTDLDVNDSPVAANSAKLRDIATPESEINREQLQGVIRDAISALPEDLRVAFTLREFDGLSYEDISQVMSCPVGTVRSRIFRAREAVDQAVKPLMDEES